MNLYLNHLKEIAKLCLSYITWDKIKAALMKALDAFIKVLWNELPNFGSS